MALSVLSVVIGFNLESPAKHPMPDVDEAFSPMRFESFT